MKQAASATVNNARVAGRMNVQPKPVKSKAKFQTKSELAIKEDDASADFLVGALLFSLFASHRSECVRELLAPGDAD